MLQNLVHGLAAFGNFQAIGYLILGTIIGVVFGVIPGLGGAVVLSVILAFISHISLTGTLCLFLGLQAASYYSASITSILLNTPAHPEAFAVTFDGFPMAQKGEAGRALGISAAATCFGGIIGCCALVGFIQIINSLPGLFKPPELVALIFLAMLLVGTLGTDQVSKSFVCTGIGVLMASIGDSPVTGIERFTFNAVGLYPGLSLVAVVLGLFAIPQMMLIFGTGTTIARQDLMGNVVQAQGSIQLEKNFRKQILTGINDVLRHWVAVIRGALIGVVCGIIPGIGGFAANFMSYGVAQQSSRKRELFGTGIAEGIIAPESSSLAKEAGGLVPIIGLGIPGSVGGALFIAALSFKGVRLGYGFAQRTPTLAYEMVWVLVLAGIIGTVLGLVLSPLLAKVTRVPGPLLVPFVMVTALIGPYISTVSFFAVMETMVAAAVGFLFRRLRYSLAAFVIGLVLGPTLEDNLFLTHEVYRGWTFIPHNPIADVMFVVAIGIMVLKSVQIRASRLKLDPSISETDPAKRLDLEIKRFRRQHPYPLLASMTSVGLFGILLWLVIYALSSYPITTAMFPALGGGMAVLALIWRMPLELIALVKYYKYRKLGHFDDPPAASAVPEMLPSSSQPLHVFREIRDSSWGINGQYTRELYAFGAFGVLVAGTYVFGFLVAIPAFAFLYSLFATRRVFSSVTRQRIFAVLSSGILWLISYLLITYIHVTLTPLIKF